MKRLIVNADDFGLTEGVNRGIIQAFREGILTSATLMANASAFDDAVALAKPHTELGVGCHVVLIGGRAVGLREEIGGLADRRGWLPGSMAALVMKIAMLQAGVREITSEILAQIWKLRAAGIEPTHLDAHKHTQCHPVVMEAVAQAAVQIGVTKVRRPYESPRDIGRVAGSSSGEAPVGHKAGALTAHVTAWKFERLIKRKGLQAPDHFFGVGATGQLDAGGIAKLLDELPDGTSELMCHPGEYDAALVATGTRLREHRQRELTALLAPGLRNVLERRGIQLISYRDLGGGHGRTGFSSA
jgi:hopanoid biosynthesis associated protein HpnK